MWKVVNYFLLKIQNVQNLTARVFIKFGIIGNEKRWVIDAKTILREVNNTKKMLYSDLLGK